MPVDASAGGVVTHLPGSARAAAGDAVDGAGRRQAWWVWSVALVIYLVAVFHRFSLGVAGVEAIERFDLSGLGLGLFSVVQLLVYGAVQIPVGVLVDRFGFKRLLVGGALLMAAGQVLLALATTLPVALGARMLLGAGDGVMFLCLLRLIAAWFPARINPFLVQVTGLIGQIGSIASTVPMIFLLQEVGWTPAFLIAGAVGFGAATLGGISLREQPGGAAVGERESLGELGAGLARAWREPGTRLGMWTHAAVQFPSIVFALLWGYPFLLTVEHQSPGAAGSLLLLHMVSLMVTSIVVGQLSTRFPRHRSRIVLVVVAATAGTWTAVLLWPGAAPLWLLTALVLVIGTNQPVSIIGFDHARAFNRPERLGSATGVVNLGGHTASLICIVVIGLVLTASTPSGSADYPPDVFRWAMAVQYPAWLLGSVQILRWRAKARRRYGRDPYQAQDLPDPGVQAA